MGENKRAKYQDNERRNFTGNFVKWNWVSLEILRVETMFTEPFFFSCVEIKLLRYFVKAKG